MSEKRGGQEGNPFGTWDADHAILLYLEQGIVVSREPEPDWTRTGPEPEREPDLNRTGTGPDRTVQSTVQSIVQYTVQYTVLHNCPASDIVTEKN